MDSDKLIGKVLPALDPPSGFVHQVMRVAHRKRTGAAPAAAPHAWSFRARLAAVAAAAVVVGGMTLALTRRGDGLAAPSSGHVVAEDRLTVALADRAVAVTEPGTELGWSTSAGALRVVQGRGEVFYRVERGRPFAVDTPAAEIRVTGTCFRVKVIPGRRGRLGTSASSLEVDVLEGGVLVRNARGQVSLGPGERAQVAGGEAPRAVAVSGSALSARDRTGEERAAALETRVTELEQQARTRGERVLDSHEAKGDRKVFDLDADDLKALARRCQMNYYLPRHLTALASPHLDESYPLTAVERDAIDRLMQEQRGVFVEELRALYIELTGERSAAATLTPKSLKEEILAKATDDDLKAARRRIFQEWLGEVAPPAALTTRPSLERFLRLLVSSGPAFHAAVTTVVGPDRARQIRARTTSDSIVETGSSEGCELAAPAVRKKL
jgi:FecR protein